MSRRPQQPLPEYATLIRWTVQEVINWLVENRLQECNKCFRDGGVDGSKLANITETDLVNIRCPTKHIGELLKQVCNVSRPGGLPRVGGGGNGIRGNQRREPPSHQNHMHDAGSGSDDGVYDDDDIADFTDSSDEDSPVGPPGGAPPRINQRKQPTYPNRSPAPSWTNTPKRMLPLPVPAEPEEEQVYEDPDGQDDSPVVRGRPPAPVQDIRGRAPAPVQNIRGRAPAPVQDIRGRAPVLSTYDDSPDENYEDPDATIKVQHFHGGPLPQLPPGRSKAAAIGQRVLPPTPEPEDEDYEEPDSAVASTAPRMPIDQRKQPPIPTSHREPPAQPEENYEDPNPHVPSKIEIPVRTGQRRPTPPPMFSVPSSIRKRATGHEPEEEYEDPDQTIATLTGGQGRHGGPGRPALPPVSAMPRKINAALKELPTLPAEGDVPPAVPRLVPKSKRNQQPKSKPVQVEEIYEIPDDTDSAHPGNQLTVPLQEEETYEVPDTEVEEQENYLAMEHDNIGLPQNKLPVSSSHKNDMPFRRDRAMPLPNEAKPQAGRTMYEKQAPLESQETYEIPEPEEVKVPQKNKKLVGGFALPGLKELNTLNAGTDSVQPKPVRPGRGLPPPPTVTPEKEPVKPLTSAVHSSVPSVAQNKPAVSSEANLRQKWYHGDIKRIDADDKLKRLSLDGMYLIRKSSQGNDKPYTLQIFFREKVYNLPIRKRLDNLFAIGGKVKVEERGFSSLLELVNNFKLNPLILAGGAETKLVKSMPKT